MDQAVAEHQLDVMHHQGVVFPGLLGGHVHLRQPRRHLALIVGDQFHQQHAIKATVGPGHSHPRPRHPVQGIHLGVLPGFLHLLAAVAGALLHGPGAAAVLVLAALLVGHGLLEAALGRLLVHLGTARFIAAAHHVHGGFLAAHQLVQHLVDETVFVQRHQPRRNLHDGLTVCAP